SMVGVVEHEGVDGQTTSICESGAILEVLGRKTGKYCSTDESKRLQVEQWLVWQMGGLGPMLAQNHHFSRFAPERIAYATERYVNESKRLYGVLNIQLGGEEYVAGDYSIGAMASFPLFLRTD